MLNQKSVVVAIEMNILEEHLLGDLSDIIKVKVANAKIFSFYTHHDPTKSENTI